MNFVPDGYLGRCFLQGAFSTAAEPILVLIVSIECLHVHKIFDTNLICGEGSSPGEKTYATIRSMLNSADAKPLQMHACEVFRYF